MPKVDQSVRKLHQLVQVQFKTLSTRKLWELVWLQGQEKVYPKTFLTLQIFSPSFNHFYSLIKHTWCIQKRVNNDGNKIRVCVAKLQPFFCATSFLQCVTKVVKNQSLFQSLKNMNFRAKISDYVTTYPYVLFLFLCKNS